MRLSTAILLLLAPLYAFAYPATYYSIGRQTNPADETIHANTGALESPGAIGANYRVSILLTGSIVMTYRLEVRDAANVLLNTIYLTAPANDSKVVDMGANFFIPDGYSLRLVQDTGPGLGGTLQASLILEIKEIN